jgi:hypothetical protein
MDARRHFDSTVKDLAAKGVKFEHYDMPDMKRDGDIHVSGDMKVAWVQGPRRQYSQHRQLMIAQVPHAVSTGVARG